MPCIAINKVSIIEETSATFFSNVFKILCFENHMIFHISFEKSHWKCCTQGNSRQGYSDLKAGSLTNLEYTHTWWQVICYLSLIRVITSTAADSLAVHCRRGRKKDFCNGGKAKTRKAFLFGDQPTTTRSFFLSLWGEWEAKKTFSSPFLPLVFPQMMTVPE